jgi:hypothetical protein
LEVVADDHLKCNVCSDQNYRIVPVICLNFSFRIVFDDRFTGKI